MKGNNIKEIVENMKRSSIEEITYNVLERVFVALFCGFAVWALYIAFADTVTGFQGLWHMLR